MTRVRTSSRRRHRSARLRPAATARTRWPERGAAAVEMAFMLPILLFVVFGIIDFGRMLNAQITLTEAAREGARAESFGQPADTRVQTAVSGQLTGVVTTVTGTCPANPDAVVSLTYPFTFITPVASMAVLFGGSMSGTKSMKGKGVMPCLH